jgi:hypothetical protein
MPRRLGEVFRFGTAMVVSGTAAAPDAQRAGVQNVNSNERAALAEVRWHRKK